MKKVGFLHLLTKKHGGVIYREKAAKILTENFDVEINSIGARYFNKIKYLKIPESLFWFLRFKGKKDIWVRDFYSTIAFRPKRTEGKNIVLIFHIDFSGFPVISRPLFSLCEKGIFYNNLKKTDGIVVISEYWKRFFFNKGFTNIYKIYYGFDLNDFIISNEDVQNFKKEYKLEGKPIVYIGNCQKPKGVVEVSNILKDLDVYLVTSGREEVKISAINLNLSYKEYLVLLKASSVVITMSKFKEGWCITAHEAMLCKTPVIGSGSGGMKELLEGGGQIVCDNFKNLKEKTEYLLNNPENRKELGLRGFDFVKSFTIERFSKEWADLINRILNRPTA